MELIRDIAPHQKLYRDPDTGIAWIEDGSTGMAYSVHPNIDASGSVAGMKSLDFWGADDETIESRGWIFNISRSVVDGHEDRIAASECRCGGTH